MARRLRALGLLILPLLALIVRQELVPAPPAKTPGISEPGVESPEEARTPEATPTIDGDPPSKPLAKEEAAVPEDTNAWKRSSIVVGLVWLARQQNADGSWGDGPASLEGQPLGRRGITALALLSFLGAGYSHLSKDEYDDIRIGDTVKRTLKWFLQDQSPEGNFGSGRDLDHVLSTLAIAEAYGLSASQPLKEPTQNALAALTRAQLPDGSWGTPAVSAWAMQALASAAFDDLEVDRDVQDRALRYASRSSHSGMLSSRVLLTRQRSGFEPDAASIFRAPPARQDLAGWLHASFSLYVQDGPEGALWNHWKEPLRQVAHAGQTKEGAWPGGSASDTLVRTSLALNLLEIYYRYANDFGIASK